jgi:hypothetical protein
LVGVLGGALAFVCGAAALVVGGPDTVIVGALLTVVAGVIAIVGALAGARPRLAAMLMIVAVLLAGLVAPGVIPALADDAVIFMAYLACLGLLLVSAVVAFRERKAGPTAALTGLHS